MSENGNLDAGWQYHSGSKHSYQSVRFQPHTLDWENKPLLFKIYPTLEVTRLPRDFHDTGRPALIGDCGLGGGDANGECSRSRNFGGVAVFFGGSHSQ